MAEALSEGRGSLRDVPLTFAAIDFETANGSSASACSVGIVLVDDGRVTGRAGWRIRPPEGHDWFSEWNVRIHGITPDQVAHAKRWDHQLDDLLDVVAGRPLVAHNAAFDMGVLRGGCAATDLVLPPLEYFCSLQIARRTYALHSYRLPVVAMAAGYDDFRHHDAIEDAAACAAIVVHAAGRHGVEHVDDLLAASGVEMRTLAAPALA